MREPKRKPKTQSRRPGWARLTILTILSILGTLPLTAAMQGCGKTPPPPPKFKILEPYAIRARVLSKKNYRDYWAPVDLLLVWGELLDPKTTSGVIAEQGDRLGWWFPPKDHPLGSKKHMIANTHLIADDEEIRKQILEISEGDTIYLEGALVEAEIEPKKIMKSSLSRTDSGRGACEVILIRRIEPLQSR